MKKALSLILVLVMMISLRPIAFTEGEGDYHITVYAGDTEWQVTTAFADSIDSDLVRDDPTNPHWKYIPSSGAITIMSDDVTEIDISSNVGKNIALLFAVSPINCFTVKNGCDNLTIKPAASMPNGLRIVKTADKKVTIQFDENTEIGNGLFIQAAGTVPFSSGDEFISNGSTVTITLDTALIDSTFNNAVAAVNTVGPLKIAKSESTSAIYNFTTEAKSNTNDTVTAAIAAQNSSKSAGLTVDSGVTLNAIVNQTTTETVSGSVYTDRMVIQSEATVNAGFGEAVIEGTNCAIWCRNDFTNYGTLKASTNSGINNNEAARFNDVNFCGGVIEIEAPNTSNAMSIEDDLTISAPLVKATVGDSKATAVVIANPGEKTIYNGKKYIKIEALNNSVSLKQSAISLGIGETSTLNAETVPDTATIISWDTDSDAVTLDKKGYSCSVTAVKAGKATITVTDSNRNTDTCEVTVTPYIPPVPPTVLVITNPASSCTFTAAGAEYCFTASLLPEDSDKSGYMITWASSNPNVAKVTDVKENGTKASIVSVAAGTCDITARCEALGLSSVRTVSVLSDFRFTSKNKLVFYYDNRSKTDCNFATTISADMVNKVTVNDYSMPFYKDSKGNITILYSSLLNTFGSKSARMPLRVYYGEGSNQYIEKTLYYMSIYDAPLTADTDMTWAYVTMLVAGLFISASPLILKKAKRRGAAQ